MYKGLKLQYNKQKEISCSGCVWWFSTFDALKGYVDDQLKNGKMVVSERASLMYI